ncbi:MAG: LysM peptidoglycan-binding domain-containing protein [Acidobacteriota bacterium]|nr:LysM peptidoglycan-binding domain-containing protein [Acidobacteriota bacterium]
MSETWWSALGAAAAVLVLAALARPEARAAQGVDPRPAPVTTPVRETAASAPEVAAATPEPPRSAPPSAAKVRDGRLVIQLGEDESLEQLAARLYGRAAVAPLLLRAGLPARGPAEIEVPLARTVRLAQGQSLGALARRHVGRADRWKVLAALSGIGDPRRARPGREIVIPAVLEVEVRRGDSLSAYAAMAWGSAQGAALIADWNGLRTGAWIHQGERIEVPIGGPFAEPE